MEHNKWVITKGDRYLNKLEKRSGSLWEGRFKSSIISTQDYLLACCRYVERNPVRAAMVINPLDYRWSSYACKVTNKQDLAVDLHPIYFALGDRGAGMQKAYQEYVLSTVPEYEIQLIRDRLQRQQVTGNDRFRLEVEKRLGIRISNKRQGRPRKRAGMNPGTD